MSCFSELIVLLLSLSRFFPHPGAQLVSMRLVALATHYFACLTFPTRMFFSELRSHLSMF